jgi:DNA (cytosine-5)-methyltransferase 1
VKASLNDKTEARQRQKLGIEQFSAESGRGSNVFPGFTKAVPYAHEPLNRYQKWLRRDVSGNNVTHQYTRRFSSTVVEL